MIYINTICYQPTSSSKKFFRLDCYSSISHSDSLMSASKSGASWFKASIEESGNASIKLDAERARFAARVAALRAS